MDVLVPVDDSDCSYRALRHGVEVTRRYDGTLHVVHFTDVRDEDTDALIEQVEAVLREEAVESVTDIVGDVNLGHVRAADGIGEDILDLVDERGYDQVVMGHHGADGLESVLLGSAAKTVLTESDVPTTVVP